jgi:ubiquinone/menaquinone biosynthesis C-methylase UbiE
MADPLEPHKNELQSTYIVQDRQNQEELTRITIQDQMITTSMGGVLPEQADPTAFHRVLDVGCGTGGWIIATAKAYPSMSLAGIDISGSMIESARERAKAEQVTERVTFHVMDTLRMLEFPPAYFDLVNLRFGVSFMRTWDWPKLLNEFQRVTRRGGVIRITECDAVESNSPALSRLVEVLLQAYHNAGHFFRPHSNGLTSELVPLLTQHGLGNVQSCVHELHYRAGTPEGQHFAEDMQHSFRTVRPFIQKWTRVPQDYDTIYQQALIEMQQRDFEATWRFVTAWGNVTTTWQTGPADRR